MKKLFVNLFTAAFIIVIGSSVSAHSKMSENMPKNGDVVDTSLEEIMLHFTKKMRLTKFELFSHDGTINPKDINPKKFDPVKMGFTKMDLSEGLDKSFEKGVMIEVDELPAGNYVYFWTGLAKDGHRAKNYGYFTVTTDPVK